MANWSDLNSDFLSTLSKTLNSDGYLFSDNSLRSVCKSWQSSLPLPQNQLSFPITVPPLLSHPLARPDSDSFSKFQYPTLPTGGQFSLNYSTLYRFSLRAGDPSDGWLVRISEVKPNVFSLLTPLLHKKIEFPPGMGVKSIYPRDRDYRISELTRCYNLSFVNDCGVVKSLMGYIRKVILLPNFVVGCDLVVMVLVSYTDLRYWKVGDSEWTSIKIPDDFIDDVIFFDGKCYALGIKALLSFDSNFNLKEVSEFPVELFCGYKNFVVYNSDLYVVSKFYNPEPEFMSDYEEDVDEEVGEIFLRLKIAKLMGNAKWSVCKCLKDNEIFLSSDDVSICVSSEDFKDCKGNCVYVAHTSFSADDMGIESGDHHAVCDLDKGRARSLLLERAPDRAKIYKPPPDWLICKNNDKVGAQRRRSQRRRALPYLRHDKA